MNVTTYPTPTLMQFQGPMFGRDSVLKTSEILSHIFDQLAVPISCPQDVDASILYRHSPTPRSRQAWCHFCKNPGDEPVVHPPLLGDEIMACRLTLRAAALCCRRFSGPALDALWRTMKTLFPLISILPSTTTNHTLYVRLKIVCFQENES